MYQSLYEARKSQYPYPYRIFDQVSFTVPLRDDIPFPTFSYTLTNTPTPTGRIKPDVQRAQTAESAAPVPYQKQTESETEPQIQQQTEPPVLGLMDVHPT